jgi:hypothetical protein
MTTKMAAFVDALRASGAPVMLDVNGKSVTVTTWDSHATHATELLGRKFGKRVDTKPVVGPKVRVTVRF